MFKNPLENLDSEDGRMRRKKGGGKRTKAMTAREDILNAEDETLEGQADKKNNKPDKAVKKSADFSVPKSRQEETIEVTNQTEEKTENDIDRRLAEASYNIFKGTLGDKSISQEQFNNMTEEQRIKLYKEVFPREGVSSQNKTIEQKIEAPIKNETEISVENVDRKEFTNKYWKGKIENLSNNREKIAHLSSDIARLKAIESYKNSSESRKKKATKQIERLREMQNELAKEISSKDIEQEPKITKKVETNSRKSNDKFLKNTTMENKEYRSKSISEVLRDQYSDKDMEEVKKNLKAEKPEASLEKGDNLAEKEKDREAFTRRLMKEEALKEVIGALFDSQNIREMVENKKEQKDNEPEDNFKNLMEGLKKIIEIFVRMYDEMVAGETKKETAEKQVEKKKTKKEEFADLIAARIVATLGEASKEKPKSEFEEFRKSVEGEKGKKYDHEKIKNEYLKKLGWEVKYNAFNGKAWLVDKEGNFIDKNGAVTKNKKEKVEFKTQWRFPFETPFIIFLRNQVEKKMGGTEDKTESKSSSEKGPEKEKEQFGPYYDQLQKEIEKVEKQGGIEKSKEKKEK